MTFPRPVSFIFALVIFLAALLRGQVIPRGITLGKGFAMLRYENNRPKTLFTGRDANRVAGEQILISEFGLRTFRDGDTNQVELIVSAPECLFDRATFLARSPGRLTVQTATTNFFIEGEGFLWQQTNSHLDISNSVHTVIHRDPPKGATGTTNPPIHIYADHFEFDSPSRTARYRGRVRVEDPGAQLTCEVLTIELPEGGRAIKNILAETDVVIVRPSENSRATGGRALYDAESDRIELLDHPRWTDPQRDALATRFIYERTNRLVRAEGDARMQVRRSSFTQVGLSSTPPAAGAGPVVISAAQITIQLPPTNGPVEAVVAEKSVVIENPEDHSVTTADRVVYSESTGTLLLTGHPRWLSPDGELKGNTLFLQRADNSLTATSNAYLKLPASSWMRDVPGGQKGSGTNGFVELRAQSFVYRTNEARLAGAVHGDFTLAGRRAGQLDCRDLQVTFGPGNQFEVLHATGAVALLQTNFIAGNILGRTLHCEAVTIHRSLLTGLLQTIFAEGAVDAQQQSKTRVAGQRSSRRLKADLVAVDFSPSTNQVSGIIADRNVILVQDATEARGQRAVYVNASGHETVELTGRPSARTEKFQIQEAELISWDAASGRIKARPFVISPLPPAPVEKDLSPKR